VYFIVCSRVVFFTCSIHGWESATSQAGIHRTLTRSNGHARICTMNCLPLMLSSYKDLIHGRYLFMIMMNNVREPLKNFCFTTWIYSAHTKNGFANLFNESQNPFFIKQK